MNKVWLQRNERRLAFCTRLLARGLSVGQILTEAQTSPLFIKLHKGCGIPGTSFMARSSIRDIILKARKRVRETVLLSPEDEVRDARTRLMNLMNMAIEKGDVKAAVLAQREMNRMLGLRKDTCVSYVTPEEFKEQMRAMQEATGCTTELGLCN